MFQTFVLSRVNCLEYLYICRAKFAIAAVNGISLPFFNNLIANTKR